MPKSDAALRMMGLVREKEEALHGRYQEGARLRKEKTALREILKSADGDPELLAVLGEVESVEDALFEATGYRLVPTSLPGKSDLSAFFAGKVLKHVTAELNDLEDAYPSNNTGVLVRVTGRKGLAIVTEGTPGEGCPWYLKTGSLSVFPLAYVLPQAPE